MSTTTSGTTATGRGRRVFAVVGATGQQGGATARALLSKGARVRALVRSPGSEAARGLEALGAELVRADLEDAESLRAAFTGVDGIFAMTTFSGPRGTEGEVEHGQRIGDAALAAQVPHVLYSSVGGAERSTGVPHFESKRQVEEHLLSLGLAVTFVRPVFFMENFAGTMTPSEEDGVLVLRMPLPAGVPLQVVAVDDVGAVAAAGLLDPSRITGGAIEIAGDEVTGEQLAAAFGDHAGQPARYEPLPLEVLASNADLHAMFAWFARLPAYQADVAATRGLLPGVKDFRAWLAAAR